MQLRVSPTPESPALAPKALDISGAITLSIFRHELASDLDTEHFGSLVRGPVLSCTREALVGDQRSPLL
jgi:hypothetical protein